MAYKHQEFSEDDINSCWTNWALAYFVDVLNGDYDLNQARNDLRSLKGTKYDLRNQPPSADNRGRKEK
jgi:hypothetical protein